jgi:signal transduction histidine kinase
VRPLDALPSVKIRFGIVIVAAVAVTIAAVVLGVRAGLPLPVCGVVAAALALGMVQFLARGLTSPLRQMAAAATAMARGDYGRRVQASSRDEVGDLARAFNAMAAELAEVDRVRRDLIANVSHELRTPIAALQAILENMLDGVERPDHKTLETMLSQVERLGRLVSQLLDLSRLESGVVPLKVEVIAARSFLDGVLRDARLQFRDDVQLRTSVEPEGLELRADGERMHQVIDNLVANAVRHSPSHGRVTVAARADRDATLIEVSDEGPGIPEAERGRVFERFYRSDSARASSDGGSGLGLAIARWIVDLHGGEIRVEGNDPHGCRIVVALPRQRSLEPVAGRSAAVGSARAAHDPTVWGTGS